MSVDTRTPRTPTGGRPAGFADEQPVLSSVKVPSDPAQVIVKNVSFRVKLGTPPTGGSYAGASAGAFAPRQVRQSPAVTSPLADTTHVPSVRPSSRRTPVVWSGHATPGDAAAGQLLQAVRHSTTLPAGGAAAATQVLPRVAPQPENAPTVVTPRVPQPSAPLLDGVRPARGAYDEPRQTGHGSDGHGGHDGYEDDGYDPYDERDDRAVDGRDDRPARDAVRHAYYPHRRMNLGIVLLPLRIFLGFISLYAGMGKLTDPVYFDGGERGSMVTWLQGLEPWAIASPLHSFAVAHPVGAGLTVAFLQVIVGVLTILGLWQRVAAGLGALLSAALLVTVSWRMVAAYDAPDIIYLAAWSPLIIAGAPVYSLDARLAGEAWRRLGPRVSLWDLRRRVLRRGTLLVTLFVGLALLIGSMLGSAVRSAQVATVPDSVDSPRNHLPGTPLPQEQTGTPGEVATQGPTAGPTAGQSASPTPAPSGGATEGPTAGTDSAGDPGQPSQDQTVQAPPQQPEAPA
ncbi:DoxX family membrane protein, partial [Streptomyces sp. OF3]